MGVDDDRDREDGDEAAGTPGVSDRRDAEGDAEERTGVGSDPAGVDDLSDDASAGDDTAG